MGAERDALVKQLRGIIEWVGTHDMGVAVQLDRVVHELETLAAETPADAQSAVHERDAARSVLAPLYPRDAGHDTDQLASRLGAELVALRRVRDAALCWTSARVADGRITGRSVIPSAQALLDALAAIPAPYRPDAPRVPDPRGRCGCCEIEWPLCRGLVDKGMARCCTDCTHDLADADPAAEEIRAWLTDDVVQTRARYLRRFADGDD